MPLSDEQTAKLTASHRVMGVLNLATVMGVVTMGVVVFVLGDRFKLQVDAGTTDLLMLLGTILSVAALAAWAVFRHLRSAASMAGACGSVEEFAQRYTGCFVAGLAALEAPAIVWLIAALLRGTPVIALPYLVVCLGVYAMFFPHRPDFLDVAEKALTPRDGTGGPAAS